MKYRGQHLRPDARRMSAINKCLWCFRFWIYFVVFIYLDKMIRETFRNLHTSCLKVLHLPADVEIKISLFFFFCMWWCTNLLRDPWIIASVQHECSEKKCTSSVIHCVDSYQLLFSDIAARYWSGKMVPYWSCLSWYSSCCQSPGALKLLESGIERVLSLGVAIHS